MTVLVAVILVVPFRWRGFAMLIVMSWSVGIGAYTTTAKWHRLSDTIGADLVALIVGAIAALILLRCCSVRRTEQRPKLRIVYVVVLALDGSFSLIIAILIGYLAVTPALHALVIDLDIYLAAKSLAGVGAIITGLGYWGTLRCLEFTI